MPIVEYDKTKYKGSWKPNVYYNKYDCVFQDGSLWVCHSNFMSGATFSASNWLCPDCNSNDEYSLDPDTTTGSTFYNLVHVVYGKYADKQNNLVSGGSVDTSYVFGVNRHGDGGYYYMEYKVTHGSISNVRCGFSWDLSTTANESNSVLMTMTTGSIHLSGGSGPLPSPWTNLSVGDILRVWIRNGKMWLGSKVGGVESVIGDPAADTGEVYTFTPTNAIRALVRQLGNPTIVKYSAKSSDIECDPLGATPFED